MSDDFELVVGKRIGGRRNGGHACALGVVLEHGFGRLFEVNRSPSGAAMGRNPEGDRTKTQALAVPQVC